MNRNRQAKNLFPRSVSFESVRPIFFATTVFLLVESMSGCASAPSSFETMEAIENKVRHEVPIGSGVDKIESASRTLGIVFRFDSARNQFIGVVDNVQRGILGSVAVVVTISMNEFSRVACIDADVVGPASF